MPIYCAAPGGWIVLICACFCGPRIPTVAAAHRHRRQGSSSLLGGGNASSPALWMVPNLAVCLLHPTQTPFA
uniref:Putative secreted protein n=1 Tax=Anopheles darlingi TaxID=43151 RepID=A0A2M4DJP8_ANODA